MTGMTQQVLLMPVVSNTLIKMSLWTDGDPLHSLYGPHVSKAFVSVGVRVLWSAEMDPVPAPWSVIRVMGQRYGGSIGVALETS